MLRSQGTPDTAWCPSQILNASRAGRREVYPSPSQARSRPTDALHVGFRAPQMRWYGGSLPGLLLSLPSSHLLHRSSPPLSLPISIAHYCIYHPRCTLATLRRGRVKAKPRLVMTYRIRTWPRLPVLLPFMNSSVPLSCIFIYESTLIRRPLYSVWPHFRRTRTSSFILCRSRYCQLD